MVANGCCYIYSGAQHFEPGNSKALSTGVGLRSDAELQRFRAGSQRAAGNPRLPGPGCRTRPQQSRSAGRVLQPDRKSTRLNSSHVEISYAVFCLKKKKKKKKKQ